MKLISLTLENFCQHLYKVLNFASGLTAIVGPNGSGKSNVFAAVRYALLGENQNTGTMDENISQLASPDARSSVSLQFSHNDLELFVTRRLRPSSPPTLVITREGRTIEDLRGATAVNSRICELTGADAATLSDYVLVSQGEIFEFLARTPARRLESFRKLFRTDKAAVCSDVLGKALTQLPVTVVINSAADLTGDIERLTLQCEDATRELSVLPELETYATEVAELSQVIQKCQRRVAVALQVVAAQAAVTDYSTQLSNLQKEKAAFELDLTTIRNGIEATRSAETEAQKQLAVLSQNEQMRQLRSRLQRDHARCESQLSSLPEPQQPADYATEDVQRPPINEEGATKQRLETFVRTFNQATGEATCPTCGTTMTNLQSELEKAQQEIRNLTQSLLQRQATARASREYERGHASWAVQKRSIESTLTSLTSRLAEIKEIPTETVTAESLQMIIDQHKQFLVAEKELSFDQQQVLVDTATIAEKLSAAQQQLQALLDEATQLATFGESKQTEASQLLQLKQHQQMTRDRLQQQKMQLTTQLSELATRLQEVQAATYQANRTRAAIEEFNTQRSILAELPRLIAQRQLQALQADVNDLLSLFLSDFRVTVDESLTFVANFQDGRVQPAPRLSGGQKVVLALAFRIAVNSMFAGSVGLLALDEPTVYLDQPHILRLASVVERLKSLVAGRGLQCLVITHEGSLSPLFDATETLT